MINKFGVENFKALKEITDLEIKPLTILTGTNSSGKSSFTQALRILNSVKMNDFRIVNEDDIKLKFNNEFSILGDFNTVRPLENEIKYTIPIKWPGLNNLMKAVISFDSDNNKYDGKFKSIKIIDFTYENEVEVFSYNILGTNITEYHMGDEFGNIELPEISTKKEINVPFLKQEFDKLALNYSHALKVYTNLYKYLALSNNEDLLFEKPSLLKEFFEKNKIDEEIKNDLEVWLKSKEFYVTKDEKYMIDNFGQRLELHSVEHINNLITTNSSFPPAFNLVEIQDKENKNNTNRKTILDYQPSKPILKYNYKGEDILDKNLQKEIFNIENNQKWHIGNKEESIPYLRLDGRSMFSDFFEDGNDIRNSISSEINSLTELNVNDLNIEFGENFKILMNGFIPKSLNYIFEKQISMFFTLKIEYIPSIRTIPSRYLSRNNLNTYMDNLIDSIIEPGKVNLKELNKWVYEFKIADEIEIESIENVGVTIIHLIKNGKKINITDVGYGVSQLLPILIRLCCYKDELTIIEEPETNLHPALQSKLADFLVDQIKKKKRQIIIETHSEYLIRRLQILVNQKKIDSDKCIVHYFNPPDQINQNDKQVKTIKFKENGILDGSFGPGFTDEANNLAINLFQMTKEQAN